jgi:hypothetical protein
MLKTEPRATLMFKYSLVETIADVVPVPKTHVEMDATSFQNPSQSQNVELL